MINNFREELKRARVGTRKRLKKLGTVKPNTVEITPRYMER